MVTIFIDWLPWHRSNMAAALEPVPASANTAAGLEGANLKDLSPAHLVILAESAIQVGLSSIPKRAFGIVLCY